jgi:hypothetical protein
MLCLALPRASHGRIRLDSLVHACRREHKAHDQDALLTESLPVECCGGQINIFCWVVNLFILPRCRPPGWTHAQTLTSYGNDRDLPLRAIRLTMILQRVFPRVPTSRQLARLRPCVVIHVHAYTLLVTRDVESLIKNIYIVIRCIVGAPC